MTSKQEPRPQEKRQAKDESKWGEQAWQVVTRLRRAGLLRTAAISGVSLALLLHPPVQAEQESPDGLRSHVSPQDGEFRVEVLGNANLTVECGPDGRIKLNGNDVNPQPVNCDFLKFFDIIGGDGPNIFNLSGMTSSGFPNIQTIHIEGREGNDSIVGSIFDDTILGGPGGDTLIGFFGNDALFGNEDNDLFIVDTAPGNDTASGGPGLDQMNVLGENGDDQLTVFSINGGLRIIRSNLNQFTLDISELEILDVDTGAGNDRVTVEPLVSSGLTKFRFAGGLGNDFFDAALADIPLFVTGGPDNDTILGGSANDSIDGGLHPDSIDGGSGNDSISGGADSDTLLGGDMNDSIDGGLHPDSIDGGSGNDSISGGADNDTILGGDMSDSISGDEGNDSISGGNDDDLLIWNNGDGNDHVDGDGGADTQQVNGNELNELLQIFSSTPPRHHLLRSNLDPFTLDIGTVETLEINGMGGDDTITGSTLSEVPGSVALRLNGGAGKDQLLGSPADDTLQGGLDDDSINGRQGDDLLIWNAGDGNDQNDGGEGRDRQELFDSDLESTLHITSTAPIHLEMEWVPSIEIISDNIEETAVDLKGGDDRVQVNYANGFSVAQMLLEIRGGAGQDSVTALFSSLGDIVQVQTHNDATRIIRQNAPSSTLDLYLPLEALTIDGQDGNDSITVDGVQSDLNVTLIGGEGNDILKDGLNFNLSPNRFFHDGGPGDDSLTTGDFSGRGGGRQVQAPGVTLSGGEGSDNYKLFFARLPAATVVTDNGSTGTDTVTVDAQGAIVSETTGSVSGPGKTVTIAGAESVSVTQKGTSVVHMPSISR